MMDEVTARQILTSSFRNVSDSGFFDGGHYAAWSPWDKTCTLDSQFTVEEIEAIAWWMRHKARPMKCHELLLEKINWKKSGMAWREEMREMKLITPNGEPVTVCMDSFISQDDPRLMWDVQP